MEMGRVSILCVCLLLIFLVLHSCFSTRITKNSTPVTDRQERELLQELWPK